MNVTANIRADLTRPGVAKHIYAVQNDRLTHLVEIALYSGGLAWAIPSGTLIEIRYAKPDGTAGYYNTGDDGAIAYTFIDNVVTIALVEQMLTVPGLVPVEINLYSGSGDAAQKLTTFRFLLHVAPSVLTDAEIESSDYFNPLTATAAQVASYAQMVIAAYGAPRVAATAADMTDHSLIYVYVGSETGYSANYWYYWNGSAWTRGQAYQAAAVNTDTTLSTPGQAADAKATGDAIGAVSDELDSVTGTTRNLFDTSNFTKSGHVSVDFGQNSVTVSVDGAYQLRHAAFYIPVTGISKIAVSHGSITGTGYPLVRVGYSSTGTSVDGWINTVTDARHVFDVSDYAYAVIGLYVSFSTASTAGDYVTYNDIQVEAGETVTEYVPHLTAVDSVARDSAAENAADIVTAQAQIDENSGDIEELRFMIGETQLLATEGGAFNTTTDIRTNSGNSKRARTAVFTLPGGSYDFSPSKSDFRLTLFEQTSGGVISQISSTWVASATAEIKSDRIYRAMIRSSDDRALSADDLAGLMMAVGMTGKSTESKDLGILPHVVPVFKAQETSYISAVSQLIDSNTIAFCAAADPHNNSSDNFDMLQPAYAKRMAIIAKALGVDFLTCLGDMIEGYNDSVPIADYRQQYLNAKRMSDMALAYTATDLPWMYVAGHHECYPISETAAADATLADGTEFVQNRAFFTKEMKPIAFGKDILARMNVTNANLVGFRKLTNKIVDISDPNAADGATMTSTGSSVSYYFDITKGSNTVRFLVIDGTFFTGAGYHPDTVTFAQTALAGAQTNGYKVVVFNHIPLRWSEYDKRPGRSPVNAKNEAAFIDVLKTYGSIILAYIHGHTHADNIVTSATESEGTYPYSDIPFPMVSISCQRIYGSSGPYIGNYVSYGTRNVKAYEGYCFDTVLIHTDTGRIDFCRYGVGDTGTYPTRSVNVT